MEKETKIEIICFAVFLMLVCVFAVMTEKEEAKYIYECTNFKGDIIYCNDAYSNRGGLFCNMEDGTKVQITSYKKILKEE